MFSNPSEYYSISRHLEPYLPLIKSRALYELYQALRYEKEIEEVEALVIKVESESLQDYRLQKVFSQLKAKLKK